MTSPYFSSQVRRIIEDTMKNIHPVYHIKVQCKSLCFVCLFFFWFLYLVIIYSSEFKPYGDLLSKLNVYLDVLLCDLFFLSYLRNSKRPDTNKSWNVGGDDPISSSFPCNYLAQICTAKPFQNFCSSLLIIEQLVKQVMIDRCWYVWWISVHTKWIPVQ